MAKKKKTSQKRGAGRRRRSRSRVAGIGMLPGLPLEQVAAFVGGAVASQALNGIAKNIKPLQKSPKILPIAKIAIGVFGLMKSNNEMLQNMAGGMIAEGGLHLVREMAPNVFKSLTGGSDSVGTLIDLDEIAGTGYYYGEDHTVSGINDEDFSVGAV
jgi:hypothetical protein